MDRRPRPNLEQSVAKRAQTPTGEGPLNFPILSSTVINTESQEMAHAHIPPHGTFANDAIVLVSAYVRDDHAQHCFARNGRPVVVISDFQNPNVYGGELEEIKDIDERTRTYYEREDWHTQILQKLVSIFLLKAI